MDSPQPASVLHRGQHGQIRAPAVKDSVSAFPDTSWGDASVQWKNSRLVVGVDPWPLGSRGPQSLAYLAHDGFAGKWLLQHKGVFQKSTITFTLFKVPRHVDDFKIGQQTLQAHPEF